VVFCRKHTAPVYKKAKDGLLNTWHQGGEKFINALKNKTSETKLDNYLVRHPLPGRIT